ncbi:universal stress protein [Salinibaculum rarum]|jgi:nucleotide-binding universal stress UspA family protein|uniref:universal stress protein n=1 Tax=Salinibaculum rarum TaxID=3058903 RepID=UPI00265E6C28|nr:universal stress protein [Salinibaculum sp. KK48]
MVFLVPFDGSPVAKAALTRAVEHGKALGEEIVAVSLVPTGATYAERRKWIQPDEDFAAETASTELQRKIDEATDDAERNFDESSAQSLDGGISDRIQQVAKDVDASVLFVGTDDTSEDDRLTTPFGPVAADGAYDVHLVRSH